MTSDSTDSPATMYGTVSLVLGVVGLITAVLASYAGIAIPVLCGALAVTLASAGLFQRTNRIKCIAALTTGAVALLYPVVLLATFGG
ncbi:hypothetical protein [Streptomyces sp. ODS28]|uniref:hypothetical protein n=1 Tax=Streptomyces sp. ODS28 TaxID=3136688 RepID=UPI0031EBD0B2